MVYPLKMVIFHSYVSLPEGIPCVMTVYIPQKRRNTTHGAFITPYPLFISENCDI